jgi:glyoxylate carboligase
MNGNIYKQTSWVECLQAGPWGLRNAGLLGGADAPLKQLP